LSGASALNRCLGDDLGANAPTAMLIAAMTTLRLVGTGLNK
jgi:hypothetical protein